MVVDVSVSFIPLLIIILFKLLVGRMDGEMLSDPAGELQLLIKLVQQQVILLGDHSVAVAAVAGEDLKPKLLCFI